MAIAAVPSVNREAALGLRRGDKENEKRDVVRTMRFINKTGNDEEASTVRIEHGICLERAMEKAVVEPK